MSWYDEGWSHRAPISVNLHGGAGTRDVSCVLPSDWPAFWQLVLATANDVRVTGPDGITPLTFQITSWNHGNKAGTLEIDNWASGSVTAAATIWIYWGKAGASSAQGSFTIGGSPATGLVTIGAPGSGSEPAITPSPEPPGTEVARVTLSKTPDEQIQVWWNLLPALMKRRTASEGSHLMEEIQTATYAVYNSSYAAQAAMVDTGEVRLIHPAWVSTTIKAGADDENYVATLTVTTSTFRTLNFHASVKVRKITAPA